MARLTVEGALAALKQTSLALPRQAEEKQRRFGDHVGSPIKKALTSPYWVTPRSAKANPQQAQMCERPSLTPQAWTVSPRAADDAVATR